MGAAMGMNLNRADNPFRFRIPDRFIPKLRDIRARQQDESEVFACEEVIRLFTDLGTSSYLAFDGRVFGDPSDWNGAAPYEVTNPKEAWAAIIVGAELQRFPELLQLLPR